MTLHVEGLVAGYGRGQPPAVSGITFGVERGRTLAVVGPSGAGKTTLLRAVAGLLAARSGDVRIDGRSIVNLPPQRRRVAVVFQDDALLPHLSLRKNLQLVARRKRDGGAAIEETAIALEVQELLARRPAHCSGGERQRASIARALLSDPRALLLDEPFAHLDPRLRHRVRDEVVRLRRTFDGPIVYVTHDHAEGMSVADAVAVIIEGRIEDQGEPQRVYDRPSSVAVARIFGDRPMNLFDDDNVTLGIRPEFVEVASDGELPGRVVARETTGADAFIAVETVRGRIVARVRAANGVRGGDLVALRLPQSALRRFDAQTGRAIA